MLVEFSFFPDCVRACVRVLYARARYLKRSEAAPSKKNNNNLGALSITKCRDQKQRGMKERSKTPVGQLLNWPTTTEKGKSWGDQSQTLPIGTTLIAAQMTGSCITTF